MSELLKKLTYVTKCLEKARTGKQEVMIGFWERELKRVKEKVNKLAGGKLI